MCLGATGRVTNAYGTSDLSLRSYDKGGEGFGPLIGLLTEPGMDWALQFGSPNLGGLEAQRRRHIEAL